MVWTVNRTKLAMVTTLFAGAVLGYELRSVRADIPDQDTLVYSGVLENADGTPVVSKTKIQVRLLSAPSGAELCSALKDVQPSRGHFQVALPKDCVSSAVQIKKDVWLEVLANGQSLGVSKLAAVPYAVKALEASYASQAKGDLDTRLSKTEKEASDAVQKANMLEQGLSSTNATSVSVKNQVDDLLMNGVVKGTLAAAVSSSDNLNVTSCLANDWRACQRVCNQYCSVNLNQLNGWPDGELGPGGTVGCVCLKK